MGQKGHGGIISPFKHCAECGKLKPLGEFYRGKGVGGRRSKCKVCEVSLGAKNRSRDPIDHKLKRMLCEARRRSKLNGRDFSLTYRDIYDLYCEKCPVLGVDLSWNNSKLSFDSPTLDRINNEKGYVPGNVVIVSWRANKIKSDASMEELEAIVGFFKHRGVTSQ